MALKFSKVSPAEVDEAWVLIAHFGLRIMMHLFCLFVQDYIFGLFFHPHLAFQLGLDLNSIVFLAFMLDNLIIFEQVCYCCQCLLTIQLIDLVCEAIIDDQA